jgi:glycosyltransferase
VKVTLITVCRNALAVLPDTLESVAAQTHAGLEHIIIDGASTDGSVELLRRHVEAPAAPGHTRVLVSEPDRGIYDAMNKGLRHATGDVVGFVNAGDLLMAPHTIAEVVDAFQKSGAEAVYGDIIMVDEHDIQRVQRTWRNGPYRREDFRRGWMPPHVATFFRKDVYDRYGHFRDDLRIGADYEILLRFMYKMGVSAVHLPSTLVRFRLGGMSNGSVTHILKANREVRASWGLNGLKAPPLLVTRKLFSKVLQFFRR